MLRTTFLLSIVLYAFLGYTQQHYAVSDIVNNVQLNRALTVNITSVNGFVAGQTMDLQFDLQLLTPDSEYGDSIAIAFPMGFTINAGADPFTIATEGQPNESLNLPLSGQVITWGDNDNNYGGIESGMHTFWVNVSIDTAVTGPQTINWYVSGDEHGGAPNFYSGNTIITEQSSLPDLTVSALWSNKYAYVPKKLDYPINLASRVVNNGGDLNQSINVTVLANSIGYSDSEITASTMVTGQTDTLMFNALQSGGNVGVHAIVMNGSLSNDPSPLNNIDTLVLNVTDSSLAYSDTSTNSILGIGDGATGVIGSFFFIPNTQQLTSISVYAPTADTNNRVSMVIYDKDTVSNNPSSLIWESDTVLVSDFVNGLVNLPCSEVLLANTEYFIGVREHLDGTLNISGNTSGFFPNSHHILFQNSWIGFEQFNFMFSPAIIPHFSVTADTCVANFSYAQDTIPFRINFQNTSTTTGFDTLNYEWTFLDSVISNHENPDYTFDSAGVYTICLKIASADCADSVCLNVTVQDTVTNVAELELSNVEIYPNPTSNQVFVKSTQQVSVEVISLTGIVVIPAQKVMGISTINVAHLANGLYLVKVSTNEASVVKQLVVRK